MAIISTTTTKKGVVSPALQVPEGFSDDGETPESVPTASNVPVEGENIEYQLSGKKRGNQPSTTLQSNLVRVAQEVYGSGAKVVIYSGQGQYGSFRHRDSGGLAADVYIQIPNGSGGYRTATPTETSRMGQAWLSQGLGSVGFGMNTPGYQQGIHLDLWTAERRAAAGVGGSDIWAYYNGNDVNYETAKANGWISDDVAANLDAGLSGSSAATTVDTSEALAEEAKNRPVEPDKAFAHYSEPPGGDDGTAYGTFSSPDIGAKVWLFFLNGDLQKPVYFAQALDPSSMQQANSYGSPDA